MVPELRTNLPGQAPMVHTLPTMADGDGWATPPGPREEEGKV